MKVKWYDACQTVIDSSIVKIIKKKEMIGRELLVIKETTGKLFAVLEDVVILEHETSDDCEDVDATIIPRWWIISPERLRSTKMKSQLNNNGGKHGKEI